MMRFLLVLIILFAPIARGSVRLWAFGPIYILTTLITIMGISRFFVSEEIRIKKTAIDVPVLLFLGVSIISMILNSSYIHSSIMEIIRLLNLALIFFITVNFIKGKEEIKKILDTILLSSTLIALFGIFQYIGVIDKSWWDNPRFLSSTYVNHNHFAGLMELTIPLSIGMTFYEKGNDKGLIYIYSFIIQSIAFLLSMSRGGWLSLAIAMIFMGVVISGRYKLRLVFLFTVLVVLGFFISKIIEPGSVFKRIASYRELDFAGRQYIWKGTLAIIKDNLFFGTGPGTFIYHFPKYRVAGLNAFINYAHNDYLQVGSEMGIIGLFFMIYIIGATLRKALKTYTLAKSPFKKWISISLGTGVLSIAIHSIGDFNLYIPANAIIFSIFSGLIFNISSRREKVYFEFYRRPNIQKLPCIILRPFIIVAGIILIVFITVNVAAEVCSIYSDNYIKNDTLDRGKTLAIMATRLNPINHTYFNKLADIYIRYATTKNEMAMNFLKMAEGIYKKAVELNPLDSWSWLDLAETRRKMLNYSSDNSLLELTKAAYLKAIRLDPFNSYYLKRFAGFLLEEGRPDQSSSVYKKASYLMSKAKTLSRFSGSIIDPDSYRKVADLALSAHDLDRAILYYRMAANLSNTEEERRLAVLGQAISYIKMSRVNEGLRLYKKGGYTKEARPTFFAELGRYYLKKGYIKTATRFSERAIRLDPTNPVGYFIRYEILKMTDNNKDRIQKELSNLIAFNKPHAFLEVRDNDFQVTIEMGEVLYKEGTISRGLTLPGGVYEFEVWAHGKIASGMWPYMVVRFNGKEILNSFVSHTASKSYAGIVVVDFPFNRLEVSYNNDYYNAATGEDRNLYIDRVILRSRY